MRNRTLGRFGSAAPERPQKTARNAVTTTSIFPCMACASARRSEDAKASPTQRAPSNARYNNAMSHSLTRSILSWITPSLAVTIVLSLTTSRAAAAAPNIIFIITDDQGYGDLSCHGNPILKTPNLDRLHAEGVRFTD